LDDLLSAVREFVNSNVSHSGLGRSLRRHGVGNLRDLKARDARPKHSGFNAYEPGYIHIDVKYLPNLLGDCGQSPSGQRVDRFNGRIEDLLQGHHFQSGERLEATLDRHVRLYNQQLPQSALGRKTPLQVMKDWHNLKSDLFKKQPY
jgi:hypothetical protein